MVNDVGRKSGEVRQMLGTGIPIRIGANLQVTWNIGADYIAPQKLASWS
jgi:hypothetical protein